MHAPLLLTRVAHCLSVLVQQKRGGSVPRNHSCVQLPMRKGSAATGVLLCSSNASSVSYTTPGVPSYSATQMEHMGFIL
jgi:hypothetical protein